MEWNADDLKAVPREPPPPGGNGGEPAPRIGAQRTWPSAWWKSFPLTRGMRVVRSEGTVHPTAQPLYLRTSPTAALKASNILVLQWGGGHYRVAGALSHMQQENTWGSKNWVYISLPGGEHAPQKTGGISVKGVRKDPLQELSLGWVIRGGV